MTEYESSVLEHYQLTTPYPTEWPAEKDNSDQSEDESSRPVSNTTQKTKPRYSALVRATGSHKSYLRASQKRESAIENLLQHDESDPLGTTKSVVGILKNLGLPVQDDIRLRNKFLLSSTTFSPSLFLSQVHSAASTQDLLNGLDVLSQSIDQKSASLKVLVESNFERFVRAKATIDNVYKEMKYQGEEPVSSSARPRTHSRHASRNSFRTSSSNQLSLVVQPLDTKKKNALVKESEYGVYGIKSHLLDVSAKAEEVWGPALGGHEKENILRTMLTSIEQFKELYLIYGSITESIKRKDYEAIIEDYSKAKSFAADAKILSERLSTVAATDLQIFQIILAVHVWSEVERIVEEFKRDVWQKLISAQYTPPKKNEASGNIQDQNMDYVEVLLELGVTENPIWVWLNSHYNCIKNKIQNTSDRSKIEIEILRRRLANINKPTTHMMTAHLKSLGRQTNESKLKNIDSSEIIEFWEKINRFISSLLSMQGILGEVVELWRIIQGFIDGKAKRMFLSSSTRKSLQYHRLSEVEKSELQKGTLELVHMIRECVYEFFFSPPVDDITSLFSPMPLTPRATPRRPAFPSSLSPTLNTYRDPYMNYDKNNLPPPSPKRGEAWETFAFWPPRSNSLSAAYYLGMLLVHIGSGANNMATVIYDEKENGSSREQLKSFVVGIRERCVTALCAAWNKDAENITALEDWSRSSESRNLTNMPTNFSLFESTILRGMQKILYIPEALAKSNSVNVVAPPSAKVLLMVQSQFFATLHKSLTELVENAEKPVHKADDDLTLHPSTFATATLKLTSSNINAGANRSFNRNSRMLLTLSNMEALCDNVVPNLITQCENTFSVKLTEESKAIGEFLNQINDRLFSSFTQPYVESVCRIIHAGITSSAWAPIQKPQEVRPYVYEALLYLVFLHTEVSTTASSLIVKVLSYLLERISEELLKTMKLRPQWTLPDLMQATLDVEFISQTLAQYTTERASEIQSQIYQELDKGTDNNSRSELQIELPEMRTVLKRLRDRSRLEFACFKKSRNRSEKPRAPTSQPSMQQENN